MSLKSNELSLHLWEEKVDNDFATTRDAREPLERLQSGAVNQQPRVLDTRNLERRAKQRKTTL